MGMTAVEKILAGHSAQSVVAPGDVVVVDVDVAVLFDLAGTPQYLVEQGTEPLREVA